MDRIFAFSSLGKILPLGEKDIIPEEFQGLNERIFEAETEIFDYPTLPALFFDIREGLIKNVKLTSEIELRLLTRFIAHILLHEINTKEGFADSNDSQSESYSRSNLNAASDYVFKSIVTREKFLPLTKHPLFGRNFGNKLEALLACQQEVAHFFGLCQVYLRYIGNPSVTMHEIKITWPGIDTKKLLGAIIEDLDQERTPWSKEDRFKKYWLNFLKYKPPKEKKISKKTETKVRSKKRLFRFGPVKKMPS